MIATMLFMIKVVVNIRNKHQITKQKDRIFTGKFFNIALALLWAIIELDVV